MREFCRKPVMQEENVLEENGKFLAIRALG